LIQQGVDALLFGEAAQSIAASVLVSSPLLHLANQLLALLLHVPLPSSLARAVPLGVKKLFFSLLFSFLFLSGFAASHLSKLEIM
jgi:hypothetical protein